jgi:hypothetical protein
MQERWSLRDLLDAHDVLDLIEQVEDRETQKQRAEIESARSNARGHR